MLMSSESTSKKIQAFGDTLTIIIFLALLLLPAADCFLKLDHAEALGENRMPARWPLYQGVAQFRAFITGVEDYFNDHFGFRKRLIRLNNHWKGQLFHDAGLHDVLIGRDGWLFSSSGNMISHYTGAASWQEQDLEKWRRLLEGRRDWLAARGAKYLVVVPPDKHRIYPEYLPPWVDGGKKPSKVQQLIQYLKDRSTLEVVDLAPALLEGKQTRPTYLMTDTHWNFYGGFVAYRAVAEALARQMPGLKPLPPDAYDWELRPMEAGDLARILGRKDAYHETNWYSPVAKQVALFKEQFDPARFPHRGSQETRPCFTLNPAASGKVMVFRDSFACSWYKFFGYHFKEVVYIWQYNWNKALIEREKPDLVIDEILERFFNQEDPVELGRNDEASGRVSSSAQ
jgi:alginate O-acetyltransferase complex protein AlgJ